MGKTIGTVAAIAGFLALTFIPVVGQTLQGALVTALGGTFAAAGIASVIVAVSSIALTIGAVEPKMLRMGSGLNIGGLRQRHGMAPIRDPQHDKRWAYAQFSGDCLGTAIMEGEFLIADRDAAIRIGDLVMFQLSDGGSQMVKRFAGLSDDGTFEVQTFEPYIGMHVNLSDTAWCYRIVAHEACRGLLGRLGLVYRVRRHPDRFIAKLGDVAGI